MRCQQHASRWTEFRTILYPFTMSVLRFELFGLFDLITEPRRDVSDPCVSWIFGLRPGRGEGRANQQKAPVLPAKARSRGTEQSYQLGEPPLCG